MRDYTANPRLRNVIDVEVVQPTDEERAQMEKFLRTSRTPQPGEKAL